jgi:hypothetical protein
MSLIRIAPLIRFLPKAHPFGSPIYVTASQHVLFASTAFGIQRSGISETDSEARIQDATKQLGSGAESAREFATARQEGEC